MSVTVVLNSKLPVVDWKHTDILFAEKFNKDTRNKKQHFYISSEQSVVDYSMCDNDFVNAALLSYNNHKGLTLQPDDILTVISMAVSTTVNEHSEEMRKCLVSFEGKKELTVRTAHEQKTDDELFQFFIREMVNLVNKNCSTMFGLESEFTTSTDLTKFVANSILLSTFKKYFDYGFELGCGIPQVTLRGTVDDWNLLARKYNNMKRIFKENNWNYLDIWFESMDVILQIFTDMRNLGEGIVYAPESISHMWSRFITYVPYGSGGQKYLSGWIQLMFPTNDIPRSPNLLNLNLTPNYDKYRFYERQDRMKKWAQICRDEASVPRGTCQFEAKFNETLIEVTTGFIGCKYDGISVYPVLGYYIVSTGTSRISHTTRSRTANEFIENLEKSVGGNL